MSVDRTRDFLALVDALGGSKPGSSRAHPSLRPVAPLSASAASVPTFENRSAFMAAIREVTSDLNRTSLKLSALTKLVKKRGMFDDSSNEVERLTLSIKEDMQSQSGRLDGLQEYIARKRSEAVAGGAKPGKPLPSPSSHTTAASASAGPLGAAGQASTDAGPGRGAEGADLLSSVQGISHGDVIVGQLKGQLLGFTHSLKGILLARSETMKAQADRRQQYGALRDLGRPLTYGQPQQQPLRGPGLQPAPGPTPQPLHAGTAAYSASAHAPAPSTSATGVGSRGGGSAGGPFGVAAPLVKPGSSSGAGGDTVLHMGAAPPSAAAFQQLTQAQLVPESTFLDARAQDVQAIERHISDLSQLFSRLATVVAEQGALVERIEDNTESALSNMEAGQAQLVRYWERVSSNRGLAVRVASMLIVTAVLFALFGA